MTDPAARKPDFDFDVDVPRLRLPFVLPEHNQRLTEVEVEVMVWPSSTSPNAKICSETGICVLRRTKRRNPPYYVWGGHPLGLASPPIRRGLPRATGPPSTLIPQNQTTAASTAKHQTAVVFHHE